MDLSSEELDLIAKYVDNHLSTEEEMRFRTFYDGSESFKKEADFQKSLVSSFIESQKEKQKEKLLKDYQSFKKQIKQRNTKFRNVTIVGIAATLLIASFMTYLNLEQSKESLFERYYTPYAGPTIVRGFGHSKEILKGMSLYKFQDYEGALSIFKGLLDESSSSKNELHLLIGICYIETNNISESKVYLKKVEDENLKIISDWYYSMALLKEENHEELKNHLKSISDSKSPYRLKAKKLLEDLSAN